MRRKVFGADTVVCVIDWEHCASVIPIFAHSSFQKKQQQFLKKTLEILSEKC